MKLKDIPPDTVLVMLSLDMPGDKLPGDKLNMSGDEKLLKESNAQNEFYLILINGDFIECRKKNNELIYLKDGKKIDGLRWNPKK